MFDKELLLFVSSPQHFFLQNPCLEAGVGLQLLNESHFFTKGPSRISNKCLTPTSNSF